MLIGPSRAERGTVDESSLPATEPRGDLVPPPRKPPTAVGTETPPPPRPSPVPRRASFPHVHPARRSLPFADLLRTAVNGALDVADAVAEALESAARR
jgi:hypothetical protein